MKKRNNKVLIIVLCILVVFLLGEIIFMIMIKKSRENVDSVKDEVVNLTETPVPTEDSLPTPSPALLPTPEMTQMPEPTEMIQPTPDSEETPTPTPTEDQLNGFKIAIDAGHQLHGDSDLEPVGPGSSTEKAKVSSGTTGVSTGVPEYQLNLDIAKRLRRVLILRGYEVYMIRKKNDVRISNIERAQAANESGADIYIRLHADGIEDSSVRGVSALYPSTDNPYVSNLSKDSKLLSECVLDAYCEKTGFNNRGLSKRDDLTGTNWSEIPVTLLEMGFMSNAEEDELMQDRSVQWDMAKGIADGIDMYFEKTGNVLD